VARPLRPGTRNAAVRGHGQLPRPHGAGRPFLGPPAGGGGHGASQRQAPGPDEPSGSRRAHRSGYAADARGRGGERARLRVRCEEPQRSRGRPHGAQPLVHVQRGRHLDDGQRAALRHTGRRRQDEHGDPKAGGGAPGTGSARQHRPLPARGRPRARAGSNVHRNHRRLPGRARGLVRQGTCRGGSSVQPDAIQLPPGRGPTRSRRGSGKDPRPSRKPR
jgi:hypothetical protein